MKTHLHVLVPTSTTLLGIVDAMEAILAPYRLKHDDTSQPNWQFDYLCLFEATLRCDETDAELPSEMHHYAGYISRVDRLRADVSAAAIVTPDGVWHDIHDFGYSMMNAAESNAAAQKKWSSYYRQLLENNPDCWVIETWAHS
ncbi:hypothetical protein [Gimesia aquarii]|uniref:Uncharacterized protein n=1 Tax=Gimesia aquarii TaxID=2527964 RepID=A0A517VPI0_9PLAN|nr:hypothetical protein [Gimesia aquarii]QDT94830.1 hypothetical protein V144x_02620 [Gimesia aquarii]